MIEVAQEGTVTGRMVAPYGGDLHQPDPVDMPVRPPVAYPFYASYSEAQYDHERLRTVARLCAAWFRKHAYMYDGVVLHGKSGLSIGFATAMLMDLPIIVVRKDGENSHGSDIESHGNREVRTDRPYRWILLDDFIASGATLQRVARKFDRFLTRAGVQSECVGVLQWQAGDMSIAACAKMWPAEEGKQVPAFSV